jgi:tetratricopeptide (TPR) repeat protein
MRVAWIPIAFQLLLSCKTPGGDPDLLPFLNLHDSVTYVGMEACRSCHNNVYEDYIHTGMGQSFGEATGERSAAQFSEHPVVYDSFSNFWYKPFVSGDSLYIMEYRLHGRDTIHKRIERVAYIIGSGHHTNSHVVSFNERLYQAPITFYTQRQKWDLAPGFENGFNSRFTRALTMECLSCHNALPDLVPGSENKFSSVPMGITCERCHGPGSLHVKEKLSGKLVDTATGTDYTIVNPRQLPIAFQTDVCERCHLQGVTVLNEGMAFTDFRPAMRLAEVMHVFLPREKDKFLMASQADRLRQSACYASGDMSCITCHNPHISVQVDQTARFNSACKNCHEAGDDCTATPSARQQRQDNCNGCHMPKSGAIDIPHVSITDHNIQIPGKPRVKSSGRALVCITDEDPGPLLMAKGYLRFYEGFTSDPAYLDSAERYLRLAKGSSENGLDEWIELYYLRGDFASVVDLSRKRSSHMDASTLFRVGDALLELDRATEAVTWLTRAVSIMPLNLEFLNKLGSAQFSSGQLELAYSTFKKITTENPKDARAHYNSGFTALNLQIYGEAERSLLRCIELDPDYEAAYLNLARLYQLTQREERARHILAALLRHVPESNLGAQR